jgi:hypothetical protein
VFDTPQLPAQLEAGKIAAIEELVNERIAYRPSLG